MVLVTIDHNVPSVLSWQCHKVNDRNRQAARVDNDHSKKLTTAASLHPMVTLLLIFGSRQSAYRFS